MTPKSLLRHKKCISKLSDMSTGSSFHRILWDDAEFLDNQKIKLVNDKKIRKVVMCSGKVYYDLYEMREEKNIKDVYIMRVEQLYPFPDKAANKELNRFKNAEIIWCQEEPQNMGSWTFIEPNIERTLNAINAKHKRPKYVGRFASASTATGYLATHNAQLKAFLTEALE